MLNVLSFVLFLQPNLTIEMMKEAKLKTLEQTDNVSLYSICFDGNSVSEYEDFIQRFKDEATLNTDYKIIIMA